MGSALTTKEIGVRVKRGRDWKWGDQDGNGMGTTQPGGNKGWVKVNWDNGNSNSYRCGAEDAYDLEYADMSAEV